MVDVESLRILIAVSLADGEDHALVHGLRTSLLHRASEVHVLYVVTTAHLYAYEGASIIAQQHSALETAPVALEARVRQAVTETFADAEPPPIAVHVRVGQAARVVLQTAVDFDIDLLVVGTHGRHGLERMLLGSVAQEIAKRARCTVLIARPKNYEGLEKTPNPSTDRQGMRHRSLDMTNATSADDRPERRAARASQVIMWGREAQ